MSHDVRCKGVDGDGNKADGTPCGSTYVDPETGYCPAHGPGAAARQRERGRKGGEALRQKWRGVGTVKADQAPERPESMEDAAALASWLTVAVLTGEVSEKRGDVVTRALREFRSATEKADLEARIKELETSLKEADV